SAILLNLAGRILEAGQEAEFAQAIAWLMAASALVLLGGSVALIVMWRRVFVWPRWLWRFSGLGVAALLSLIATQVSFRSTDPAVTRYQTIPLWISAVVIALLVTWPRRETSSTADPTPRWELIVLLAILALALLLRVVNLGGLPYVLMGDESKFALQARAFNQGLLYQPFQTAMDGHWGLWFMVLGTFTRLFGETIEALRLQAALFGTLSILATYALTRLLWGHRPALIAAALLATYHFHIHFSRNAMNNIYDALFSMLIFGLFWLGWSRPAARWAWLLGGLALGLAQYFYIGGRVIPVGLALLGVFWLITDRARVKTQARNIALAIGVFAVAAMPIAYFAPVHFDQYMTRFNQTNILRNGWLEAARQAQQVDALTILGQQLRDTIQVFIAGPESLFYEGQSLLLPAMSVLACAGLIYLLWHIKEGRAFYVVTSLGLILLIGGVLTLSPMDGAHHFVGAAPLIYIAIAVFIDRVGAWAGRRWPTRWPMWAAISLGVITILMLSDAYYYFGTFAANRPTFSTDAEPSMRLGEYLRELEQRPITYNAICVRLPGSWCSHDTVIFLAPHSAARARELTEPPRDSDWVTPPNQGLVVIVSPRQPDDLAMVQARFLNSPPHYHYGIHGNLLFTSFEIPAAQP
ncbi:MAG TPA: glycosyltransferase family 39 protein, partial [Anaerolineae bacterium]|nr:glycosyltransferase family 39 protein [Anaerolineae bacterium]